MSSPKLGKKQSAIAKDLRVLQIESHFIFYRYNQEELVIIRILHKSMLFSQQLRGRVRKKDLALPCETLGLLPFGSVIAQSLKIQTRQRAVDMFERDDKHISHPEANNYYDDLDTRNLLFGAGISGTTGTLLQSAEAFGKLDTLELKKQYCVAIAGYLVGGGMHSYHEVWR